MANALPKLGPKAAIAWKAATKNRASFANALSKPAYSQYSGIAGKPYIEYRFDETATLSATNYARPDRRGLQFFGAPSLQTAGGISFGTNIYATGFANGKSLTQCSVFCLVNYTSGAPATFPSLFNNTTSLPNTVWLGANSAIPQFTFANNSLLADGLLTAINDGIGHVWAATYNGTEIRIYCDGFLIQTSIIPASTVPAQTNFMVSDLTQFFIGKLNSVYLDSGTIIGGVGVYDVGLTAMQVKDYTAYWRAIADARGNMNMSSKNLVLHLGDSITVGTAASVPANCWRKLVYATQTVDTVRSTEAVGGTKTWDHFQCSLTTAWINAGLRMNYIRDAVIGNRGYKTIVIMAFGANDASGGVVSAPAIAAVQQQFIQWIHSIGDKNTYVVLCTPTCLADPVSNATCTALAGLQYSGGVGLLGQDATIDFNSNQFLNPFNGTYYNTPDGIHPIDAGHAVMASIAAPVLASLLALPILPTPPLYYTYPFLAV